MPDDKDVRNKKIRIGIIYFIIVIVLMLGVNYVLQSSRVQDVIYSEFKQWVKDGKVDAVEINVSTGQISFTVKNDNYKIYNTYPTETASLITEYLEEYDVPQFTGRLQETNYFLMILLQWVVPILIFVVIWRFLAKGITKNMGDSMSFGSILRKSMLKMRRELNSAMWRGRTRRKNPWRRSSIFYTIPRNILRLALNCRRALFWWAPWHR